MGIERALTGVQRRGTTGDQMKDGLAGSVLPNLDCVCEGYVLRMMPDYGPEAIWRVGGHCKCLDASLSLDLEADLERWVLEWIDFHDCDVRDDTNAAWVRQGRELYRQVRDHYAVYGTKVLADFEGSIEEQVERRRRWHHEYRDRDAPRSAE